MSYAPSVPSQKVDSPKATTALYPHSASLPLGSWPLRLDQRSALGGLAWFAERVALKNGGPLTVKFELTSLEADESSRPNRTADKVGPISAARWLRHARLTSASPPYLVLSPLFRWSWAAPAVRSRGHVLAAQRQRPRQRRCQRPLTGSGSMS